MFYVCLFVKPCSISLICIYVERLSLCLKMIDGNTLFFGTEIISLFVDLRMEEVIYFLYLVIKILYYICFSNHFEGGYFNVGSVTQ